MRLFVELPLTNLTLDRRFISWVRMLVKMIATVDSVLPSGRTREEFTVYNPGRSWVNLKMKGDAGRRNPNPFPADRFL